MKHQLTSNVKLLHKVVIEAKGQILLVKRSPQSQSRPSCWDLPGGNSEWPTSVDSGFDYHRQDIVRELQEEINLSTHSDYFSNNNLVYFRTYFDANKNMYTILCGWLLKLDSKPDISLSSEHTKFDWINPDQLKDFDFGGQPGDFIKDIISNA